MESLLIDQACQESISDKRKIKCIDFGEKISMPLRKLVLDASLVEIELTEVHSSGQSWRLASTSRPNRFARLLTLDKATHDAKSNDRKVYESSKLTP